MGEYYHPDDVTLTVITTLLLNLLLSSLLFLLFLSLRSSNKEIFAAKIRTKPTRVPASAPVPPHPYASSSSSSSSYDHPYFSHLISLSEEETLQYIGLDAHVCLRFLFFCLKVCGICGLLGGIVLIPVYFTAEKHQDSVAGINLYTMGNIDTAGDRLWASTLFCYLFTFLFLYLIHEEYAHFSTLRLRFLKEGDVDISKQVHYSVLVEDIPSSINSSAELKQLFEEVFEGQVYCAVKLYQLKRLDDLIARREVVLNQLEHAIACYKSSNMMTRQQISLKKGKLVSCGCGDQTTDAIDYFTLELNKLNKKIRREKKRIGYPVGDPNNGNSNNTNNPIQFQRSPSERSEGGLSLPNLQSADAHAEEGGEGEGEGVESPSRLDRMSSSGGELTIVPEVSSSSNVGVVTFNSRCAQAVACQIQILTEKYDLVISPAAPASDIIWSNVDADRLLVTSGVALAKTAFNVGILFWGTIVSFIAAVSNLHNLSKYLPFVEDLDSVSYSMLAGILPVALMSIFLSLLPIIFQYGSIYVQRRKLKSEVQFEVFYWYFKYQLANIFITLVSGSVFKSLEEAIDRPKSIVELLAAALPSVSVFFINFILSATFIGNMIFLLQPGPLAVFTFYRLFVNERSLTQRDILQGPLKEVNFDYGSVLPAILFIFCIVLVYWVIAPMITIVAFFYFLFLYFILKYQFLFVFVPVFETGGKFWFGLFDNVMCGLMISVITLIGYIGIKEGVKQAPCLLPLPFIIYYTWKKIVAKFEKRCLHVPFTVAVELDKKAASLEASSEALELKEEYYLQPSLVSPDNLGPVSYRIGSTPLFNQHGDLNPEYYKLNTTTKSSDI